MAALRFERRLVETRDGDTIAAALFRHGIRTFNRSLKSHRRRGLYCVTGDCANCLVTVDGVPGERACVTEVRDGMQVARETGWPRTERDALAITDRLHWAMPVGFYYKVFVRPRWAWGVAERLIRRATGTGTLPRTSGAASKPTRYARVDVLVIGGGVAGLAAAAAAEGRVLLVDEGRIGAAVPDASSRAAIERLATEARNAGVEILERHAAIGIYEGLSVPLVGPDELVEVEAARVIVATGALEAHGVFPGNDLPGVWLARGAAHLAAAHGVAPGERAVVVANTDEALASAQALRDAGVEVTEVRGRVLEARGSKQVASATVLTPEGRRAFVCDALVLSLGWAPRDSLLRMSPDPEVYGAGDVVLPGCTLAEAEASGRAAAAGDPVEPRVAEPWPILEESGYVCVCEDVGVRDLEAAWDEGWSGSEILKRYTTATMGPCQGALCSRHLAAFTEAKGAVPKAQGRTTARPPVRAPRLEDLIGGVHEAIEKRTALHETHVAGGARLDRSGVWMRPAHYGDCARGDPRRPRAGVVMDVATLGKFLVAGRDARTLLDRAFPLDVGAVAPGRARYLLALDEAGYVMDDGLLGGAGRRILLPDLDVGRRRPHGGGAPQLARPARPPRASREPDRAARRDQRRGPACPRPARHADRRRPVDGWPSRTRGIADITVAGVPCRAIADRLRGRAARSSCTTRAGRGPELWDALCSRPDARGTSARTASTPSSAPPREGPHLPGPGHDARRHARQARHVAGPSPWTKRWFVGKQALERMAELPMERKLVGLEFDGPGHRRARGAPLLVGGRDRRARHVGRALGSRWAGDRPRLDAGARRRLPVGARRRAAATAQRSCRRPSTTRTECGCVAELRDRPSPTVVAVLASAATATGSSRPPARACCRVAPGEVLSWSATSRPTSSASTTASRRSIASDVLDCRRLGGLRARRRRRRARALAGSPQLDAPPDGRFVQGEVAHVAAKVLVEPDAPHDPRARDAGASHLEERSAPTARRCSRDRAAAPSRVPRAAAS